MSAPGTTFASFGCAAFEFVSAGAVDSTGVSPTLCSTETYPCSAGIEINKAEIINTHAAAIVIRANTDAVPRGPNAELEILLVNKAPASVFPGCNSTEPTRTTHATKNNVYRT